MKYAINIENTNINVDVSIKLSIPSGWASYHFCGQPAVKSWKMTCPLSGPEYWPLIGDLDTGL